MLIALLKAASPAIEARYVQGTLSSTDSTTLLVRMFASAACVGLRQPLRHARQWRRVAWRDQSALLGGIPRRVDWRFHDAGFGIPDRRCWPVVCGCDQTFTSIATSARHQTRIRVEAETYSQASAMFGFGRRQQPVLDRSFDSADLVDKPVSISHFVNAFSPPSLAIGATRTLHAVSDGG